MLLLLSCDNRDVRSQYVRVHYRPVDGFVRPFVCLMRSLSDRTVDIEQLITRLSIFVLCRMSPGPVRVAQWKSDDHDAVIGLYRDEEHKRCFASIEFDGYEPFIVSHDTISHAVMLCERVESQRLVPTFLGGVTKEEFAHTKD